MIYLDAEKTSAPLLSTRTSCDWSATKPHGEGGLFLMWLLVAPSHKIQQEFESVQAEASSFLSCWSRGEEPG